MADTFSKKKRSEIMSRIRSRNTSLELKAFRFLRREGIYFQKHYRKVAGSPDIALPRKKKAVFIDGDFWHGWKFVEATSRLPESYWKSKIAGNVARDRSRRAALKRRGWKIICIWEHDLIKKEQQALQKIKKFLLSS